MKRSLAFMLALVSFAASACSNSKSAQSVPPAEAEALLLNRNWIDKLPERPSDRLHVYRFVPSMGGGVFQDRTLFAGLFELFTFEHTGEEIRFQLPHADERATCAYHIEALRGDDVHGPLDLRLTIDRSPRGPSVYYGMRAESSDLDEGLRSLIQR